MGTGTTYLSKKHAFYSVFCFVLIIVLNIYISGNTAEESGIQKTNSGNQPSELKKNYYEDDDDRAAPPKSVGSNDRDDDDDDSDSEEPVPNKEKKDSVTEDTSDDIPEKKAVEKTGKLSKLQLFECKDNSKSRESDRPHKKSDVNSLFNCDKEDSLCHYYYPANFFDENCGLGKSHVQFIDDAKQMMANGTLWNFMPSVGFPTLTVNDICLRFDTEKEIFVLAENSDMPSSRVSGKNVLEGKIGSYEEDGKKCSKERLSFVHVHKAGGSSLHQAFNFFGRSKSATIERHKFFDPSRTPGRPSPPIPKAMLTFTLDALGNATKYPDQRFKANQHVIFAAVRDPTERFISSIGQALGASGSGGNRIGPVLKQACVHGSSADALKCLAKYVRDHGFWIELHFTPQVLDISFTTMWQDVPIAMFSFKNLPTILDHFGRANVHVRDGSKEKYRSDPILTNMSVNDYDDETLEIVCKIYEMDVVMQRSLGMEVPRCDKFLPRPYDFEY